LGPEAAFRPMFLFIEVEGCALERDACVRHRGTDPANAKHLIGAPRSLQRTQDQT
jgi:hypothetical protein